MSRQPAAPAPTGVGLRGPGVALYRRACCRCGLTPGRSSRSARTRNGPYSSAGASSKCVFRASQPSNPAGWKPRRGLPALSIPTRTGPVRYDHHRVKRGCLDEAARRPRAVGRACGRWVQRPNQLLRAHRRVRSGGSDDDRRDFRLSALREHYARSLFTGPPSDRLSAVWFS